MGAQLTFSFPCGTKFLEQMLKQYAKTDAKLYAKFFGFA